MQGRSPVENNTKPVFDDSHSDVEKQYLLPD
jgi:hypothetical protein